MAGASTGAVALVIALGVGVVALVAALCAGAVALVAPLCAGAVALVAALCAGGVVSSSFPPLLVRRKRFTHFLTRAGVLGIVLGVSNENI